MITLPVGPPAIAPRAAFVTTEPRSSRVQPLPSEVQASGTNGPPIDTGGSSPVAAKPSGVLPIASEYAAALPGSDHPVQVTPSAEVQADASFFGGIG